MYEYRAGGEEEGLLDLHKVMQAFGVSEWANLGPTEMDPVQSLSLRVEFAGQHYILRERAEGMVMEDSGHRYAFRQFLHRAGIPIPSLWLTPEGEAAVQIGEDYFELEQEVDGERFSTASAHSLTWLNAAATMLARIHQASRRYLGPQQHWPSEVHIGGVVQGYLNLARSRAEESEIPAIAAAISNCCDAWETMLPSAMVSIGAVRGLPEFHIHGDYHALNLRFNLYDVQAVLNWEASHWEKRIIELAFALFHFSALKWQASSPVTRPLLKRGFDPERARRFLEAYAAIYPPVPQEASVLGDALLLVSPIAIINGPLEDVFFTPHGIEDVIDDVMERLAWATSLPAWLGRVRRSMGEMWLPAT
jgi:Ser/Thr protein kinase RdoA (MazF antagonist)